MIWLFPNSSGKCRGSKGVTDDTQGSEGRQRGRRGHCRVQLLDQEFFPTWWPTDKQPTDPRAGLTKSWPLSDFCKTMGSRVFLSVRNLAAKRLKGGNNENQLGFPWIWKAVGIEIFFLIELNSNLWYFASTGICDKMLGRDCKERLDIQFIISHRVEKKTIAIASAQKIDHRSSLNAASNVTSDNIWLNGQHISQCQCWWNRELVDDRCMHRRSNTLLNAASYDLGSIILDIVYSNFKKTCFIYFCRFVPSCWSADQT